MTADIKTREIDRTPKMKDAAARLPKELVRDITTKPLDSVKNTAFSQHGKSGGSMSEDASDRLESGMERTADYGSRAVRNGGKKTAQTAIQKYKKVVSDRKQKNAVQTAAEENGCNPAESFPAPEPISAEPSSATGTATEPDTVSIREKQENGGRGTDPMQSSECPYNTKYANSPGAIQDPEYSIQVGIQYYADCVEQAECESPADMGRLQLSWQGYNYGNRYIGWALANYGGYSLENALEFSQQQAASHGWSGYGDPEYVPHIIRNYINPDILLAIMIRISMGINVRRIITTICLAAG